MDLLLQTAWALIVGVVGLGLVAWWLAAGLARQKRATSHIEESLDLSRRSLHLCEISLELTEQMVKNQEEMIRLLRRLADPGNRQAEAIGAFQPPPEAASAIPRG